MARYHTQHCPVYKKVQVGAPFVSFYVKRFKKCLPLLMNVMKDIKHEQNNGNTYYNRSFCYNKVEVEF